MRSLGVALVVLLVVLQAAALSPVRTQKPMTTSTPRTTTEPTRRTPTTPSPEPTTTLPWATTPPPTTTTTHPWVPTTPPPPPTTITSTTPEPTTTSTPWTTPTTTKDCPVYSCPAFCSFYTGPDDCWTCGCPTTCEGIDCPENEVCVLDWSPRCIPATTTPTTTETTVTWTPTPTCPISPLCDGSSPSCTYNYDYSLDENGCPYCVCVDPVICGMLVKCGPDEDCLPSEGAPYGYACFSKYPTTTPCPAFLSPCDSPACIYDYSSSTDGCPVCMCGDTICKLLVICGPDEECLPTENVLYNYACHPKYDTTTPLPTKTTTHECFLPPCARLPGCGTKIGPDGCLTCACNTCDNTVCPEGEVCQLLPEICWDNPCLPDPTCVPTNGTTTVTPTPTPCPAFLSPCEGPACSYYYGNSTDGCPICICGDSICGWLVVCGPDEDCIATNYVPYNYACYPKYDTTTSSTTETTTHECFLPLCPHEDGCGSEIGPDGCIRCACNTCAKTVCPEGEVCQLEVCWDNPCMPQPTCVPANVTTSPCPQILCPPNCSAITAPDGCGGSCECPPTCETVKCSAGYECKLVEVTCIRYPCFPQPQCVLIEDPCIGTPNPHRCGRCKSRKYRWTYNSVTDNCERFRYYGCTPSPNTFSSKKACKNTCQAEETSPICLAVACADDCYTFTKRNQCPKCICPNPCQVIRCRAGYECKLRGTECGKDPEPFCAPSTHG